MIEAMYDCGGCGRNQLFQIRLLMTTMQMPDFLVGNAEAQCGTCYATFELRGRVPAKLEFVRQTGPAQVSTESTSGDTKSG